MSDSIETSGLSDSGVAADGGFGRATGMRQAVTLFLLMRRRTRADEPGKPATTLPRIRAEGSGTETIAAVPTTPIEKSIGPSPVKIDPAGVKL